MSSATADRNKRVLPRRWLLLATLILIVVLAALVGTPFVIKRYAVDWLEEHGGQRVSFQDVDFNPFTATLLLKGLTVSVDDQTTLAFETAGARLAWRPLLHKQIEVQAVRLQGLHLIVDERQKDRLLIGGIHLPAGESDTGQDADATESRWSAGITSVTLNDIHVRYLGNGLDLRLGLEHLSLSTLAQWSPAQSTQIEARGSLNNAPFELSGELAPLAPQAHYNVKLALESLPLGDFMPLLQDRLRRLSGRFSYDGTLAYTQDGDSYSIGQEGTSRVQALDTAVKQPAITVGSKDLTVKSKLSLSTGGDTRTLKLASDVAVSDLDVVAENSRLALLRATLLKVSELSFEGTDSLSAGSILAENLELGRYADDTEQDAYMDVDRFEVSSLALADQLLSIDEVHYTGGRNHLRRDSEGNWRVIAILNAMNRLAEEDQGEAGSGGGKSAATGEPERPLSAAIGRIKVDGDSSISLVDQSVKPVFETTVRVDSAQIESLDTRKPESPSPVNVQAGIGKHTRLALQGEIQPFASPVAMDVKANINALDLPPLSPYTRESLGLVLDSGSLDADATVKIDKQRIDALVKLDLQQLELETVKSKNSLQSRLPVPLNVALDTLRDSNNRISLKIPIEGDPANPDFDINDVLGKALATGVKKGALTYLTLALQPYGTLITAAKYAGETISKVRLNPVEFDPGQAALDDTDKDYLSKVAKVMKERPQLAIKLCGVAVSADADRLQQQAAAAQKSGEQGAAKTPAPEISETQLQALAKARADAVEDYLVSTFKTPADHLVGCRPRVEPGDAKAGAPRTDLLI